MDILKNLLDGDDIYFYIFKSKEELEEYKFKNINHKYTEIDTKPTGSSLKGMDDYAYIFNYLDDKYVFLHTYDMKKLLSDRQRYALYSYFGEFYDLKGKDTVSNHPEFIKYIEVDKEEDEIIESLMTSLFYILDKSDIGYIHLYSRKEDGLVLKYLVGTYKDIDTKWNIDRSLVGEVFVKGESRLCNTRDEIVELGKIESLLGLEESIGSKVNRIIVAPIRVGNEVVGTISFAQIEEFEEFTERDLTILDNYSEQIGYRLRNKELLSQLKYSLTRINNLNSELDHRNEFLFMRNKLYDELINLSVNNKGIKKILDYFYKDTGIDIFFFDKMNRETIYNRLDIGDVDGLIEKIVNIEDLRSLVEESGKNYYVYPIKNSLMTFGHLIIDRDIDKNSEEYLLLEIGINVLGMEYIKEYGKIDSLYTEMHNNFMELVASSNRIETERLATSLNLNRDDNYTVITIDINRTNSIFKLEELMYTGINYLKPRISKIRNIIYGFNKSITIIFAYKSYDDLKKHIDIVKEAILKADKEYESIYLSVGIGSDYEGLEGLVKSYKESIKASKYLERVEETKIEEYSSIGMNKLFIGIDVENINEFIEDSIGKLRLENPALEETLFTYIKNDKSIKETSEELFIHRNTLYKRLEKIEEVLEMKLTDPEEILRLYLAYYLDYNFS